MLYSLHILDYLDPVNTREISNDEEYKDGQVGKLIQVYEEEFPDLLQADLVLVGCREERGARRSRTLLNGPDTIRRQFYQLYHWHQRSPTGGCGEYQDRIHACRYLCRPADGDE